MSLAVAVTVTVEVTVVVTDQLAADVALPLLVTVTVREKEELTLPEAEFELVFEVVGVMEGLTDIVGVMEGVALKLEGAYTETVFPVPNCPLPLSPQQEVVPPAINTHV